MTSAIDRSPTTPQATKPASRTDAPEAALREVARQLISDVEALLIDPAKVDAGAARRHVADAKRLFSQTAAEPPSGMSIPPPAGEPSQQKIKDDLQQAML